MERSANLKFEKDSEKESKQLENDDAATTDAFLLCYSIIMLNVDLHSVKMAGKRMKRNEFVERTKRVCPKISEEILNGIYSRIIEKEIKTEIDCIFSIIFNFWFVEILFTFFILALIAYYYNFFFLNKF
jgi:hypothetical protein